MIKSALLFIAVTLTSIQVSAQSRSSGVLSGSSAPSTPISLTGGALATPSYTFTGDLDTGMWHSAANTLDFSAGAYLGIQVLKSTGAFANVGVGGVASVSDVYPLLISRDQDNTSAFAISNVNGGASAAPKLVFIGDTAAASGADIALHPNASAVDAYQNRLAIRSYSSATGISLIAAGTTPNNIKFYYNGGAATDEMFRIGNLAATLMNGSALKFNGSTSGTVTVNVGATPTSHTLTLPSAQGAAGSKLGNDGSGGLTWSQYAFSGWCSTGPTLVQSAWTTIAYDTEDVDSPASYATGTFTAPTAGYYFLSVHMQTSSLLLAVGQTIAGKIEKNATTTIAYGETLGDGLTRFREISYDVVIYLAASDTITNRFYNTSASGGTLQTGANVNTFRIFKL